jgi:hypothetical protein
MGDFRRREACPVCASAEQEIFYSAPLDSGTLREFIESHYRLQGSVNWSYLKQAQFELSHCAVCDLIFQTNAPTDKLLTHLYTEMISPEYLEYLEVQSFSTTEFMRTAGELAVLFRLTRKPPLEVPFSITDLAGGDGVG